MNKKILFLAGGLSIGLFGCAISKNQMATRQLASGEAGTICESQSTGKTINGDDVIVCNQLFSQLPYVKPPADDTSNKKSVSIYGALTLSIYGQHPEIIDREGNVYLIVDSKGKPIANLSGLPKNLKMPENTYLYTIYKVTGAVQMKPAKKFKDIDDNSIHWAAASTLQIASMTPAIQLTGCAVDSAMQGTWAGTVSAKTATGFVEGKTEAISINFVLDKQQKQQNLVTYAGNLDSHGKLEVLPDAEVFTLLGQVNNMHSIPTDPFVGAAATATLSFYPITVMHSSPPGDNHIAITYPSGMTGFVPGSLGMSLQSQFGMFAPAALIQEQAPKAGTPMEGMFDLDFTPHGAHPPSIFRLHLSPVQIGLQNRSCE